MRTGSSWINTLFGIVLVCVVGYVAVEHGDLFRASPTLPRQVPSLDQGQAHKGRPAKKTGVASGSGVAVAEQPVAAKDGDASPASFSVFSGTDGQTIAAESMCSRAREVRGEKAFRACIRAQVAVMANLSTPSDLIGLSAGERESIESVCGNRAQGSDGYNRCLNVQVASLAEEPLRPDFSGLSDANRKSSEVACKSAKDHDGPAAYDRCLVKFVKLMAESK